MCLYFRVMMTSVTSEELIGILEEKLEQKLALFKSTFDEAVLLYLLIHFVFIFLLLYFTFYISMS